MNMKNLLIQKIPLLPLLELLSQLYEEGAEYIDITGMASRKEDTLGIAVREEYYVSPKEELSEDELNKLI